MLIARSASIIKVGLNLLAAISVIASIGCSSKSTTTLNVRAFSAVDSQILKSANIDYESLKANSSPEAARQELVRILNTEKGVTRAYLGADGTSVFFKLEDGYLGIVDTYDPAETPQKTTTYLPNDDRSVEHDVNVTKLSFSSNDPRTVDNLVYVTNSRPDRYQPPVSLTDAQIANKAPTVVSASKRVLVLQPICPGEKAYTPVASDLPAFFKANGWKDDDIDLRLNTEEINEDSSPSSYKSDGSGLLVVKPEDYFGLNKYGVILFFGHGATGAEVGDPQQYYLEFANITSQELKVNTQLRTWALNNQLAVGFLARSPNAKPDDFASDIYRLFIRSDLLAEKMGKLPQSYVQLASCHGSGFRDTFISNGATDFMSWDSRVDPGVADDNVKNMVKLMLAGKSASDSYNDTSVIKIDNDREHWGAEFVANMNSGSSYYLPAWINLKVPALPAGTSRLKVEIMDTAKNSYVTEDKAITPGQTSLEISEFGGNCFPPGPCSVSIKALDGKGSTLLSNTSEFDLHVGANNLTVGSSKYQYAISGSQNTQTGFSFSTQGVTALQITLNGQYLGGANGNWTGVLEFDAQPGDVLGIRIAGTTGEYASPGIFSTSLSPLWLTSWAIGDQVKITDGGSFSQYFNGAETVVLDVKFTIPGKRPTTTQPPINTPRSATPTNCPLPDNVSSCHHDDHNPFPNYPTTIHTTN